MGDAAERKRAPSSAIPADRQALAEAIAAHAAAAAAVARLKAGVSAAKSAKWAAETRLERSRAATAEAHKRDTDALASAALEGQEWRAVERTEPAAQTAEREAASALDAAKQEEAALSAALAEAEAREQPAKWKRDSAVRDVLLPHAESLAAQARAAFSEALKLAESLAKLAPSLYPVPDPIAGMIAVSARIRRESSLTPPAGFVDPWAPALTKLKTDATTPLPPIMWHEET